MGFLENILWVAHILVAIAICGFVLLQHGKGADMGAAFGSGASGSIFGSAGSANFLSRTTAALATVFFVTSLGLTYYSAQRSGSTIGGSIMDRAVTQPADTRPAQPADVPLAPFDNVAPGAPDIPVAPTTSTPQENSAGDTAPNP
ncbi:MAG: preprotein translocase subunit SecG [Proteobacteria bacterium]|nr:preprotein translocase subunit SecG [Pseudomonadota bacterium]MCL2307340.1 preprotein translocase subunit SecG [Pseudomonadota bacterium]